MRDLFSNKICRYSKWYTTQFEDANTYGRIFVGVSTTLLTYVSFFFESIFSPSFYEKSFISRGHYKAANRAFTNFGANFRDRKQEAYVTSFLRSGSMGVMNVFFLCHFHLYPYTYAENQVHLYERTE